MYFDSVLCLPTGYDDRLDDDDIDLIEENLGVKVKRVISGPCSLYSNQMIGAVTIFF